MFCRTCRFNFYFVLKCILSKVIDTNLEYNKGVLFVRLEGFINHNVSYKINNILVPKILERKIKYLVFNFCHFVLPFYNFPACSCKSLSFGN